MKLLATLLFLSIVCVGRSQVEFNPKAYDSTKPNLIDDRVHVIFKVDSPSTFTAWAWLKDEKDGVHVIFADRTSPLKQVVFLMQQNIELSQRLDRAEQRIDSLSHLTSEKGIIDLINRIESVENRPQLYIDHTRKELWMKCFDGCDIFIRKL